MPITPTSGQIIIPAKMFDKYWVGSINIASDINSTLTTASVVFIPYREIEIKDQDGVVVEIKKEVGSGFEKVMNLQDLFGLAATKPEVAQLIDNLLTTIESLAKGNGII